MNPIRKVIKHGKERWQVDLRKLKGGREYYETERQAEKAYRQAVTQQSEFGRMAFALDHDTRVRYLKAERRLLEMGLTIEDAVDHAEKTYRPKAEMVLKSGIEECLLKKTEAGGRKRAIQQLGYSLKSFYESMPDDTLCSQVRLEDVEKWLANDEWNKRTRKNRLIDLRTFFAFAIRRKWMTTDPGALVEPIKVDASRIQFLTIDQAKRLMEATQKVRPEFLPFVTLGLFAGVRPEECKQLTWNEVNLETGYVEIPAHVAKRVQGRGSRQHRKIQLQPNAIAWLKLKGDLPPVSWQDRWDEVREAAGFAVTHRRKWGREKRGKACKGEPWPKNGMRHAFCTYCLPVFGEIDESRWAGHSPDQAHRDYDGKATKEQGQAFFAIFPPATAPAA